MKKKATSTTLVLRRDEAAELTRRVVDLTDAWLAGRNEKTKRGYLSDLNDFARWLGEKETHTAVERLLQMGPGKANQTVMLYIAAMKERKPSNRPAADDERLSSSTISRRIAALRSMIKIGRRIGMINWTLDVEVPKAEARRDVRGPGLADLQLINRAAAAMGDSPRARRDRAILALLFDLGLRRAELCGLDLADVEMNANGLPATVAIVGKGHREKERLTVPDVTGQALAAWIEARGNHAGPLFERCDGRPVDPDVRLSGETVRQVVERLGRAAGVGRTVRPHGLRHAAATAALDAGKHVRDVKKFTRHSSLDMVLRYDDARRDTAGEIADLLSRRREERR
jgi:integrase/recombinase XerC